MLGLPPNTKLSQETKLEDTAIQALIRSVIKFEDWLEDIISGAKVPEGYILMLEKTSRKDIQVSSKIYDEFCPLLLNQFKSRECSRAELQQKAKEDTATLKLNKIRSDQENRVLTLRKEVDRCVTMAELIEYNLEDVDAAIIAVRVALSNGMSWNDLARMVKDEKKAGNPVAGLIDRLHLERNCMTLLLSNNLDDMDDDEKTLPADKVEVDLALSAHPNARRWYDQKKKPESKQEKTDTAHEKAFKAAERKTRLQLSQEKAVASISHMRKVHWFKKFNWFVSSENYLVISGRDAQHNEMIVKRYMSKGDLYIHADLHGASSTVIKNHKPDTPVPPLTLNQAGCFTVCHSQAWDSKIITSAWWVYPHQVSKTAPTGEYLTVGSFMIRGKKNFLPPHPLIMGFGLLFLLDESSLGSHLNERRVRGEEDGVNEAEETGVPDDHSETESENDEATEILAADPDNNPDEATISQKPTEGISDAVSSPNDRTATKTEDMAKEVGYLDKTVSQHTNSNHSDIRGNSAPVASSELDDLIDRALVLGTAAISSKTSKDVSKTKYDISHMDMSEENNDNEESKGNLRDKPYISKAERRKLKKGHKDDSEQATTDSKKEKKSQAISNPIEKKVQAPLTVSKVRGQKKGKLKKMKEKYANQDEEERQIRMTLLARVTNDDVIHFIHLVANHRLNSQIRQQSSHFLRGFQQLIQKEWIDMFNEHELQLLISGSIDGLDIDDLRVHTNYAGGYHKDHYVIEIFWEVLKGFSLENQMNFLKFVTGCSRGPLLGFKHLEPWFCIQRAGGEASEDALSRLPTSATCMNLLKLPPYRSKEQLEKKLFF
ncbi:unnamed protein product [Rhodiola kirilowii]